MPSAARTEGRSLVGTDGRALGTLGAVLFHPREPRAVGVTVARPRLLWLFARRPRHVTLGEVDLGGKGAPASLRQAKRLPSARATERRLGYSWDETVIWRGMPARGTDGERLGVVGDVAFDAEGGAVRSVCVSGGVAADLALGRADVPGEAVRGFDGRDIVVDAAYDELELAGGAAAAAGRGAAKAREAAAKARDAAGKAARDAGRKGVAVLKALESVVEHEGAKKALRRARRMADGAVRDPDAGSS